MLMAPIFAILLGPAYMVPLITIIEIPVGIMLFMGARQDVDWKFIGPVTLMATIAMPLGMWFLVNADTELLTKIVSSIVLVFVVVLAIGWNYRGPRPLPLTLGIGGFSGTMMATTSIGGPPLIVYMLAAAIPATTIRANLIAYFLLVSIILVGMFGITAHIGVAILIDSIILTPMLLLGSWIGSKLANKAADKVYRWIAFLFLTFAGLLGLFG